jgi:hypothetical protein
METKSIDLNYLLPAMFHRIAGISQEYRFSKYLLAKMVCLSCSI